MVSEVHVPAGRVTVPSVSPKADIQLSRLPMHPGLSCTRAYFLGRVALLAAGAVSTTFNCPQLPVDVAFTGEMTSAPDYSAWDSVLQKHVRTTEIRGIPLTSVDYKAIRDDPNFATFVKSLETAQTSGLGKDAEYALWINSYNALAIKMVTDHPCKKKLLGLKKDPIASIKDIGTIVSPVWKKPAGVIGGQMYSLDDIENTKLRAPTEYPADPLLHACIVCASVSCPDVAMKVFKPETLKSDMEASMKNFLANTKKGMSLDKDTGRVTISKIFQWFSGDFTKNDRAPSVLDALLPYMPDDVKPFIAENKGTLKIEYFDYDWGLNGPNPGAPGKKGRC